MWLAQGQVRHVLAGSSDRDGGDAEPSDREKADRAMEAMLQMKKLDLAALEEAFAG